MTETDEPDDKDRCPICGQPCEHVVTYGNRTGADFHKTPTFRDDVVVCRTRGTGVNKAYVHHERNAVVKSISRRETPKQTGFMGGFFD